MKNRHRVMLTALAGLLCVGWPPAAAPAGAGDQPDEAAVALLRKGRPVLPVAGAANMAEYLRVLARRARTEAVQSYVTGLGQQTPAPVPAGKAARPAFEWLAEAITGKPASLEIDSRGRWCLYEHGDPNHRFSYAARGGILCKVDYFSRAKGRSGIWTVTKLTFDRDLAKEVVATGMEGEVLEAQNAAGKTVERAKAGGGPPAPPAHWRESQLTISLPKADFPGQRIARLRVRASVLLRTGATTFVVKTLGHKKPVVLTRGGLSVTVLPLRIEKSSGKETWRLPIEARAGYPVPRGMTSLGESVVFRAEDGKQLPRTSWSGSSAGGCHKILVSIQPHTIDPASTQMFLEYPTGLKIVPVELTFRDVTIRDIQPRPKR